MSKFEAMKFVVSSYEGSEALQKHLFSLGYRWAGRKMEVLHPFYTAFCPYIFTSADGELTWAQNRETYDRYKGKAVGFLESNFGRAIISTSLVTDSTLNVKVKPPIGLKPRKIHIQLRINEIVEAMKRYNEAMMAFPIEWTQELFELQGTLALCDLPKN